MSLCGIVNNIGKTAGLFVHLLRGHDGRELSKIIEVTRVRRTNSFVPVRNNRFLYMSSYVFGTVPENNLVFF
jgi:hypothetical protein